MGIWLFSGELESNIAIADEASDAIQGDGTYSGIPKDMNAGRNSILVSVKQPDGEELVLQVRIHVVGADGEVFLESFGGYEGSKNNKQADTGLTVAHGGKITGWGSSGAGAMHAVDRSMRTSELALTPSDWAIMIFKDNVITSGDIEANASGKNYQVSFEVAPAVYGDLSQATKAGDALRSLHPWEFGYWSEKMRREKYDFDDEALRPWFPVDGVIAGMFRLFGGLFGIQVVARDTYHVDQITGAKTVVRAAEPRVDGAPICVWHPEVRFYEVRDGDRLLGSFYTDWFPRESKRGGAWMNFFRTGGPRPDGSFAPHLGLMCGNFTPPVAGKEALLNHDEVTTVFHEFGHLLHHLLSEVEVESLSGVRVAWDFVELPSQILENWCWEEESLAVFARHHETGAPLPSDLLAKLDAAANFRAASTCMRQLAFSKLDLDLHIRAEELRGRDLDSHWNEDFADWQARTTRRGPAMARRFNHLFSDATGYAAGYYSYKWAEALEADAFTRFLKEGVLNPQVGRELRAKVLAKGNSEPAEKLFRDFMGRDLDPEALLERDGLA